MTNNQKLVGRHKRLAFMKVGTEGTYDRITGFTSLIEGKEAKEYARQYIDEATERTDVVGYATGIEYAFDRYTNNAVHEKIANITDDELLGVRDRKRGCIRGEGRRQISVQKAYIQRSS